ncbi:MAG: ArsR family transcriptional regulator [Candidatus Moranbacteria bacterium]|jgi:DNA-binding transcriptional ArsR family regulator|nr:metalloregulator ArsR/SmtB family transcription factor [Bacteroidales bacterium]NCU33008.1 ArsR family transcriptional regulator [Candidatus Moranbacteria bacterium]
MAKQEIDIRKIEDVAQRLRAIAHPVRIKIISMLEKQHEMNVTSIYERLDIEQAAASHHLNILKSKGVLLSRRDGKNTYYSLKPEAVSNLLHCISVCCA